MFDFDRPLNVLVQGITGRHGRFHTAKMLGFGTKIVAGTSPNQTVKTVSDVPVFQSVAAAKAKFSIDASVIFVPAPAAKSALVEAIENGIRLIVCITEGIPVHDFLEVKQLADARGATIVGPNCPGILAGRNLLGIIPAEIYAPGNLAIISKSGTLTYAAADALKKSGIGAKYIVGIGGDPIKGTTFTDWLPKFERDPAVDKIVLIGEIGGHEEQTAADFIRENITKPVFAYVAGHHMPAHQRFGHAGAIIGGQDETADAKTTYLKKIKNIHTADSLDQLVQIILDYNV
ncbi:MAG: succinate--CoA ligase subunit alpha [Candidatus Nomurabacteria bacterium]|jgi:succinyl-CoA synthetase alpha subunit|nr:succinate--CoA ligase subunit alpha [Candidatus Nomurabacteria bacterium]